jgi:arabinogalactan endo-1,4-beta-galactosidase
MLVKQLWFFVAAILLIAACRSEKKKIYLGVDLSYINEIESCGGIYRSNGDLVDPFELFAEKGTNLVRVRLWHNPEINRFSGFEDVKNTIKRAKENKMEVLLDFHYSDIWADPHNQIIPRAWKDIRDQSVVGDSVFRYTLKTLLDLNNEGLLPEFVQVGNETNIEVLQPAGSMVVDSINWPRNIFLMNKGIAAVKEASKVTGKEINIMIHIAQPENAFWWFRAAIDHGLM